MEEQGAKDKKVSDDMISLCVAVLVLRRSWR
jgi:hypothetical protein